MQTPSAPPKKVKFAAQADPELIDTLSTVAAAEGRQLQSLVDEALRGSVERKQINAPRKPVVQALHASMDQFDSLYRELSK